MWFCSPRQNLAHRISLDSQVDTYKWLRIKFTDAPTQLSTPSMYDIHIHSRSIKKQPSPISTSYTTDGSSSARAVTTRPHYKIHTIREKPQNPPSLVLVLKRAVIAIFPSSRARAPRNHTPSHRRHWQHCSNYAWCVRSPLIRNREGKDECCRMEVADRFGLAPRGVRLQWLARGFSRLTSRGLGKTRRFARYKDWKTFSGFGRMIFACWGVECSFVLRISCLWMFFCNTCEIVICWFADTQEIMEK